MTTHQKAAYWGAGLVVFVVLLFLLRDVLLPFVAGMAVAYFFDPVCDRIEEAGLSRTLATSIVTGVFFIAFVLVLALVVPLIVGQVVDLANAIPGYIEVLQKRVFPALSDLLGLGGFTDPQELIPLLSGYAGQAARFSGEFLRQLVGGLTAVANVISLLIITPIVAFYLLRDWDKITAKIDGWLPLSHAHEIREQIREIDRTLSGFVRGQATVCLILGVAYAIGLAAVGLDFGLVVGFLTGLLSFVPYFGMLIGFGTGMVLAILQFDSLTPIILVAVVFGVGQLVEGNFLTPKLVGGQVGLHAVWIIFALMAGGALFGFLGILLAVPVAAVIGVLARYSLTKYLASALYRHGAPPGSE